jgi:hypothetical protein
MSEPQERCQSFLISLVLARCMVRKNHKGGYVGESRAVDQRSPPLKVMHKMRRQKQEPVGRSSVEKERASEASLPAAFVQSELGGC